MKKVIVTALGISFLVLVGCASNATSPGDESPSVGTDTAGLDVDAQMQARAEKKVAALQSSLPKDEDGNYVIPKDWRISEDDGLVTKSQVTSGERQLPNEMRRICAGGYGSLLVCCSDDGTPCCVSLGSNTPCGGWGNPCGCP
jgi:hypothetical protein